MNINWLSRMLLKGPRLVLCLSEADYAEVIEFLDVSNPDPWMADGCCAYVHTFRSPQGRTAVVCLNPASFESPIEIASVITHESVHVWQRYCEYIDEDKPGIEIEAYVIENIAKTLMEAYVMQST